MKNLYFECTPECFGRGRDPGQFNAAPGRLVVAWSVVSGSGVVGGVRRGKPSGDTEDLCGLESAEAAGHRSGAQDCPRRISACA